MTHSFNFAHLLFMFVFYFVFVNSFSDHEGTQSRLLFFTWTLWGSGALVTSETLVPISLLGESLLILDLLLLVEDSQFVQFSLVTQSCPTLCNHMNRSMPGLPAHHQLLEFKQIHVHWVGGAIQPSHPLSSPSPPAFSLSQHQGLFRWVSSSHQVAKILEFQLQHQSFQWIPRTDFL